MYNYIFSRLYIEESVMSDNRKFFSTANMSAMVGVFFWCWSGTCFAKGSLAMGAMPYLAVACIVGVFTGIMAQLLRGHRFSDIFNLPLKVIITGFLGVSVYTVSLVMAVGMSPEADLGQVILVNYLWPIFMVLMGIFLLKEKVRISLAMAGAFLGFVGVVAVKGLEIFSRTPASLLPHLMALVGAFLWAFYCIMLKKWGIPEEKGGSTFMFLLCGILAAIIGLINGEWWTISSFGWSTVFWIVFLGIGPIGLGYHFWEIGVKKGSAGFVAVLAYFIPIGSALLIGYIFKEAFSPGLLPGAFLIVAGAFLCRKASIPATDSAEQGSGAQ
jgi:drug/metabolite transporter (DMT)-like permease